ncbi:hypothetical protein [Streptomyces sp. NBC_01451]|uniref:hypothetical protein n=1 Tax=Streptomyces sp. NBC_01451 TaxID=2903872 RepID=UPI002E3479D3|nr:hypothetical protein [Streptomyces sp. NBC_01451]
MIEDVTVALALGLVCIDHGWMGVDDPDVLRRLRAGCTPMPFAPTAYALGGLVFRTGYVDAWRILYESGVSLVIGADDRRCAKPTLPRSTRSWPMPYGGRPNSWAPPRSVR